jgi:ubiquinone/menaquinone biosynthesis C-methylase UbiE
MVQDSPYASGSPARDAPATGHRVAVTIVDQSVSSVSNFAAGAVVARVAACFTSALGLRFLQHVTLHPFHREARTRQVASQFNGALAAVNYALFEASSRPESQNLRRRVQFVEGVLSSCPGGNLLDAGCGTGLVDRTLLLSRPRDFHITVLDQSLQMIEYCVGSARNIGSLAATVGRLERMPYADASFDVSLALGVLEYADLDVAVGELSRVTRPGGLVVVSMLNALGVYRLTEWYVYQPLLRALGFAERALGLREENRHGAQKSGIRAYSARALKKRMKKADLLPIDIVYYDVTFLVPPLDRVPFLRSKAEGFARQHEVWGKSCPLMGTAYLIVASRAPADQRRPMLDELATPFEGAA